MSPGSKTIRHSSDRETLLPLYIGLLVHNKTRKRDLIDILHAKGLSVSYDRVLQLSTDVANKVLETFEKDDFVCPTTLRKDLYTTGNLDNIDHNPSSTSAQSSFHGTAISITQHVTNEKTGTLRHEQTWASNTTQHSKSIKPLPDTYTHVPPAAFPNNNPLLPQAVECVIPGNTLLTSNETQQQWLSTVYELLQKEDLDPTESDNISWSAYFANLQEFVPRPPAITGLLPLFRESAHTLAMVKHGMDIIKTATNHLNPGQIPVVTVDQPLYAIAKNIQWTSTNMYGEDKYVLLMGGLHIEMALLSVLGDWLEGSGWKVMLSNADVTTEGRADSLQRGSDTARAQWAHQVSAAALFALQTKAYSAYQEATEAPDEVLPFPEWCEEMSTNHPQFYYS